MSFDAYTNSSPSIVRGNHGTAVAGIIGAVKDNNLGVAGVAPNCSIMSASVVFSNSQTAVQLANSLNWAWQNGADVINNSWGGGTPSNLISDAISNALTNGRNGLGTIVVFSAGNNNSNVSYPANSNNDILAVGAVSPCAERKNPNSCDGENWWGSNFGDELDIVSPGVLITTTDRTGTLGYIMGDYTFDFNGTSSAAPFVSGVVALILSANPNLTLQEVNDIIESTAQKVGGYNYDNSNNNRPNGTWNEQMGYGLVDAYAAVSLASFGSQTVEIQADGDEFTACYSNTNTTILSVPNDNPPYNWSVSSNIDIVQNNGHSIEIKANTNAKGPIGLVTCTYGNPPITYSQEIWLNTPFAPASISGPSNVSYDALVSYQAGEADGAEYYVWFLPHPFDIATEPLYFHPNWWMFENNTRYIQAYTADGSQGNRNGYVQVMGANKCGLGDVKFIQVQQGSGGNGGIRIVAYPNEADNELNVDLSQMPSGTLYVYLYDSTYNLRYYGEQTNDTIKTINTLGLEEGIYFLQVYDGVTVETQQIIINH